MEDIEREAIVLGAAWAMIDDMVNWSVFNKPKTSEFCEVVFAGHANARLQNILLVDFLSAVAKDRNPGTATFQLPSNPKKNSASRATDRTFLFQLRQVCENPQLGGEPTGLSSAVEQFSVWLEEEFVERNVNLYTIDVVADVKLTRKDYITICGNIAKHSLARLSFNVSELRKLLEKAGHPISEQDGYLAMAPFFEWFHENVFYYHSSQIAELLNNICWGIYEYLRPEFNRSRHVPDPSKLHRYRFDVPPTIKDPLARAMYWELMNRSRRQPLVPRFAVDALLKRRH